MSPMTVNAVHLSLPLCLNGSRKHAVAYCNSEAEADTVCRTGLLNRAVPIRGGEGSNPSPSAALTLLLRRIEMNKFLAFWHFAVAVAGIVVGGYVLADTIFHRQDLLGLAIMFFVLSTVVVAPNIFFGIQRLKDC